MARIVKEDEPFERVEMGRDEAIQFCQRPGPDAQGRAPRDGPGRPGSGVVLPAGRVHRPVPRAARAHRRGDRGLQAPLRGRGLLEGRCQRASSCSGSTAPPGSASRTWTTTCKQVEEAKRRDHRVLGKQLELFTDRAGRRPGPGLLAAQGGRRPPAAGELPLRRADPPRLPAGQHARASATCTCTRLRAIIPYYKDASSRRSRWPTASGTCCGR